MCERPADPLPAVVTPTPAELRASLQAFRMATRFQADWYRVTYSDLRLLLVLIEQIIAALDGPAHE